MRISFTTASTSKARMFNVYVKYILRQCCSKNIKILKKIMWQKLFIYFPEDNAELIKLID